VRRHAAIRHLRRRQPLQLDLHPVPGAVAVAGPSAAALDPPSRALFGTLCSHIGVPPQKLVTGMAHDTATAPSSFKPCFDIVVDAQMASSTSTFFE